ncbi:hypothetical protein DQG23_31665 [Paenibacillus contaminans]|uniref:Uncharacterized protein n=1 Tax=Paenibacillus contaminans TaxID=450362 RepID=A0A329M2W3_9BACL|nr:hypothetical protein DQG23_31665 [Paenibacillus contaminans]
MAVPSFWTSVFTGNWNNQRKDKPPRLLVDKRVYRDIERTAKVIRSEISARPYFSGKNERRNHENLKGRLVIRYVYLHITLSLIEIIG